MSWLAEAAGIPHGGLDIDAVTWVHPEAPPQLAHENVRSIWDAYRRAGATHLVLAQVICSRDDLDGYRVAVPGADITVFRLRAGLETLLDRVAKREGQGPGAAIHRRQAEELFRLFEEAGVEDHLIQTDGRSPHEIATEIFRLSGWRARS